MPAGEFSALVTAGIAFRLGTVPDVTLPAMHKAIVGQAALAADIRGGEVFTIGQRALAGNAAFVKAHQTLLEFFVVIPVGDMNCANAAIKAAGGGKGGI